VDLPELARDLSIANRIEEVAENRVCVSVHVGAFAGPLQGLKFINRVLLGHGVLDLRSTCLPCDLIRNCKLYRLLAAG
jgi:hypothetical protein